MNSTKLKLGLLLDSFMVPAWVYDSIQRVVLGGFGEFVLVGLHHGNERGIHRGSSLYSLFNRIDEKLFTKQPDPFALRNIETLLKNVLVINVVLQHDGNGCRLNDGDAELIRAFQLDVLIQFGFEGLHCETLNVSRYGTWFYHHGDDRSMRNGPPGFWEVMERWPETTSALLAAGGRFFPYQVLFRSHFVTYPLSPARQRSYYFWAVTPFLARQIALLGQVGEEKYIQTTCKFNAEPLAKIRGYETPSEAETISAAGRLFVRLLKEFFHRRFLADQWFLLFGFNQQPDVNPRGLTRLNPPMGKFWADPHILQVDGKYYVFVEEFSSAQNKGYISVIELDEDGQWKPPVKVLEKEYHLSYPFVFKWRDKIYMVPESRANKTIDLYECVQFPSQWVFKQHLMEHLSAVDTTLFYYADKWWLFTALAEHEAAAPNVELFLFYADDLFSADWKSHPHNPIVSDVKYARSAGSIFVRDDKIFRPSQDCSRGYGHGIDLNEIVTLTETDYAEQKASSIRPDWDRKIVGAHTYATCGNLTVIDAMTYARKV